VPAIGRRGDLGSGRDRSHKISAMFRPFRLLVLGALALFVYAAFFAVPDNKPDVDAFDADAVANYELEMWKAAKVHSELSIFLNSTMMLRDLNRMTWYRSAQEGYSASRALNGFVFLTAKYERVIPDLEDALDVEKTVKQLTFDTPAVARTQLDWLVSARLKNSDDNETGHLASLMAEEYGARFHLRPDQVYAATAPRAEAYKTWILGGPDPDYTTIGKLLVESYRNLKIVLQRARAPRPTAVP
jgi:hypothetical protein